MIFNGFSLIFRVFSGPFADETYAGWYTNREIPAETVLFDEANRQWPIGQFFVF